MGPLEIAGFEGRNPEALAVGACGPGAGVSCLFIGDIGDNATRRREIRVARVAEPDLGAVEPPGPLTAESVALRYPDGPVDAEALLVDDGGVPYVVSKVPGDDGRGQARLYAAPGFADGLLVEVGAVPVPPASRPWASAVVGNVVTGADSRPGRVLLRTYDAAVEYVAPDPAAPLSTFPTWPAAQVPAAREPQGEAVAYALDGCGFYTVSEQVADLWFTPAGRRTRADRRRSTTIRRRMLLLANLVWSRREQGRCRAR